MARHVRGNHVQRGPRSPVTLLADKLLEGGNSMVNAAMMMQACFIMGVILTEYLR